MGQGGLQKRREQFYHYVGKIFGWTRGEKKITAAYPNLRCNRQKYQQLQTGWSKTCQGSAKSLNTLATSASGLLCCSKAMEWQKVK